MDPGTGVRRARGSNAYVAGRGGRTAQISREGRSGGFRLGPAHARVTGWMEAHTHVHEHRHTDVHTEATRGTGSAGAVGRRAGEQVSNRAGVDGKKLTLPPWVRLGPHFL